MVEVSFYCRSICHYGRSASAGHFRKTAIEKYDAEGKSLKQILENVERQIILEAYEKYGTTTKAAEALGISQASVSLKLNKYGSKKE